MSFRGIKAKDEHAIPPTTSTSTATRDHRFINLVGLEAWQNLPHAVQQRFSKRWSQNECVVYQGHVSETYLSWVGSALAQLSRVIGAPLPFDHAAVGPAIVVVTQNPNTGAQNWVRTYTRTDGTTQTITSQKRFCGPTGLEEYVGGGIGMTLKVSVVDGALVFQSSDYFFELGPLRMSIPRVLSPGHMTIVHRAESQDRFCFDLRLEHRLFGAVMRQRAHFSDPT